MSEQSVIMNVALVNNFVDLAALDVSVVDLKDGVEIANLNAECLKDGSEIANISAEYLKDGCEISNVSAKDLEDGVEIANVHVNDLEDNDKSVLVRKWDLDIYTETVEGENELIDVGTENVYEPNIKFNNLEESDNEPQLQCQECPRVFRNIASWKRHTLMHMRQKGVMCCVCNRHFINQKSLLEHMKIHTGEVPVYPCSECKKEFRKESALIQHLKIHTGKSAYKCDVCQKYYRDANTLNSHMRIHTGETPFHCLYCPKKFRQNGNLGKHMRIHTGERPYECFVCFQNYSDKKTLLQHLRRHTGERPFKCRYCGKSFTQISSRKEHERLHTGEQPFECVECHKTFASKGNMRKHLITHRKKSDLDTYQYMRGYASRPMSHICDICQQSFPLKKDVIKHMREHRQEESDAQVLFRCSECSKAFIKKTAFLRHMRRHMVEKESFQCMECHKTYKGRSCMTNHMARHSGIVTGMIPYQCDICNQTFTHKSKLNSHMNLHIEGGEFCPVSSMGKKTINGIQYVPEDETEATHSEDAMNWSGESSDVSDAEFEFVAVNVLKGEEDKENERSPITPSAETRNCPKVIGELMNLGFENGAVEESQDMIGEGEESTVVKQNEDVILEGADDMAVEGEEGIKMEGADDMVKKEKKGMGSERPTTLPIEVENGLLESSELKNMGFEFVAVDEEIEHMILWGEEDMGSEEPAMNCSGESRVGSHITDHDYTWQSVVTPPVDQHVCSVCYKNCSSKKALHQHQRCHIVVKQYKCKYCNKSYKNKSGCQQHERLHTGERPFECVVCHKAFTTKANMKKHFHRHTSPSHDSVKSSSSYGSAATSPRFETCDPGKSSTNHGSASTIIRVDCHDPGNTTYMTNPANITAVSIAAEPVVSPSTFSQANSVIAPNCKTIATSKMTTSEASTNSTFVINETDIALSRQSNAKNLKRINARIGDIYALGLARSVVRDTDNSIVQKILASTRSKPVTAESNTGILINVTSTNPNTVTSSTGTLSTLATTNHHYIISTLNAQLLSQTNKAITDSNLNFTTEEKQNTGHKIVQKQRRMHSPDTAAIMTPPSKFRQRRGGEKSIGIQTTVTSKRTQMNARKESPIVATHTFPIITLSPNKDDLTSTLSTVVAGTNQIIPGTPVPVIFTKQTIARKVPTFTTISNHTETSIMPDVKENSSLEIASNRTQTSAGHTNQNTCNFISSVAVTMNQLLTQNHMIANTVPMTTRTTDQLFAPETAPPSTICQYSAVVSVPATPVAKNPVTTHSLVTRSGSLNRAEKEGISDLIPIQLFSEDKVVDTVQKWPIMLPALNTAKKVPISPSQSRAKEVSILSAQNTAKEAPIVVTYSKPITKRSETQITTNGNMKQSTASLGADMPLNAQGGEKMLKTLVSTRVLSSDSNMQAFIPLLDNSAASLILGGTHSKSPLVTQEQKHTQETLSSSLVKSEVSLEDMSVSESEWVQEDFEPLALFPQSGDDCKEEGINIKEEEY